MGTKQNHSVEELDASFLDMIRSLSAKKQRETVLNKEFVIDPEVFHPGIHPDITEFINKEIVKVMEEEIAKKTDDASFDFLEVGCGAGCTAILSALASEKSRVWATDINEAAAKNTMENAKLHGVEGRLKAVVADVFNHEEIIGRKFDMIYWNHAWFLTEPGAELEPLMRSVTDPGYQSLRQYLAGAKSLLKPTGRLFLVFSFGFGSEEVFKSVAGETGWRFEICAADNFFLGGMEIDVNVIEFFKKEA